MTKIKTEKQKRYEENDNPLQIKDTIYIKENSRLIKKFKKPLFRKYRVQHYNPILGEVKIKDQVAEKTCQD